MKRFRPPINIMSSAGISLSTYLISKYIYIYFFPLAVERGYWENQMDYSHGMRKEQKGKGGREEGTHTHTHAEYWRIDR